MPFIEESEDFLLDLIAHIFQHPNVAPSVQAGLPKRRLAASSCGQSDSACSTVMSDCPLLSGSLKPSSALQGAEGRASEDAHHHYGWKRKPRLNASQATFELRRLTATVCSDSCE